jgi:hypothetical protein
VSPIFILDNSSAPARYGITASLWANRLGLPLWSLRPDFAGDVPDSHQHVIRAGYCVTSGLWRSDTLREEVRDIARLPSSDAVIVLASSQAPLIADLPGQRLYSDDSRHRLTLSDGQHTLLDLTADRYGRWDAASSSAGGSLRIALIGREGPPSGLSRHARLAGRCRGVAGAEPEVHFLRRSACPRDYTSSGFRAWCCQAVPRWRRSTDKSAWRKRRLPAAANAGVVPGMQSMMTAAVRRSPGCESAIPAKSPG